MGLRRRLEDARYEADIARELVARHLDGCQDCRRAFGGFVGYTRCPEGRRLVADLERLNDAADYMQRRRYDPE
jgi:hypothetical protein